MKQTSEIVWINSWMTGSQCVTEEMDVRVQDSHVQPWTEKANTPAGRFEFFHEREQFGLNRYISSVHFEKSFRIILRIYENSEV